MVGESACVSDFNVLRDGRGGSVHARAGVWVDGGLQHQEQLRLNLCLSKVGRAVLVFILEWESWWIRASLVIMHVAELERGGYLSKPIFFSVSTYGPKGTSQCSPLLELNTPKPHNQ